MKKQKYSVKFLIIEKSLGGWDPVKILVIVFAIFNAI